MSRDLGGEVRTGRIEETRPGSPREGKKRKREEEGGKERGKESEIVAGGKAGNQIEVGVLGVSQTDK